MAETAENVAEKYHVDRASQDRFALASQQKAAKAKAAGSVCRRDRAGVHSGKKVGHYGGGEHPRADTTLEALAKLPTPFRKGGTVTAGNASGINDGAVAMFVATEAGRREIRADADRAIRRRVRGGRRSEFMGIGPIPAVQKLLARLNLKMDDVDFLELNEAFAAQALACTRAFGLPDDSEKVNPNGGAIALGHPLGMSGARLVLTSAMHLKRTGARRAIASMCVGVGQGIAVLLKKCS